MSAVLFADTLEGHFDATDMQEHSGDTMAAEKNSYIYVPMSKVVEVMNLTTYASVARKCSDQMIPFDHELFAHFREISHVAIQVNSLKAVFESLSPSVAQRITEILDKNQATADTLAQSICTAAAIPMPPMTVLRVAVSPLDKVPLQVSVPNSPVKEVFVSAYNISNAALARVRSVCFAASKSIEMMREHVWCLKGKRVIILCISREDSIDIRTATRLKVHELLPLLSDLHAEPAIHGLFTRQYELGPSDHKHVIVMFCYGIEVQRMALPELELCLTRCKIDFDVLCATVRSNVEAQRTEKGSG